MSSFGERATVIPVDVEWLTRLFPISCRCTTRATRRRVCTVKWVTDAGVGAEFIDTPTCTGTRLIAPDGSETLVGLLEALEQSIVLHAGDVLTVTATSRPWIHVITHRCTLPDALASARLVIECSSTTARSCHVVTLRAGEIDVLITSVAQGEPSFDPRRV